LPELIGHRAEENQVLGVGPTLAIPGLVVLGRAPRHDLAHLGQHKADQGADYAENPSAEAAQRNGEATEAGGPKARIPLPVMPAASSSARANEAMSTAVDGFGGDPCGFVGNSRKRLGVVDRSARESAVAGACRYA
jgi:hypothetical protein